jgi:hypothetical protein
MRRCDAICSHKYKGLNTLQSVQPLIPTEVESSLKQTQLYRHVRWRSTPVLFTFVSRYREGTATPIQCA